MQHTQHLIYKFQFIMNYLYLPLLLLTCLSASSSISINNFANEVHLHWRSAPLTVGGNPPSWDFLRLSKMEKLLDEKVLNFSYILIKEVPMHPSIGATKTVCIDRSVQSIALLNKLRQCKFTMRQKTSHGPLINHAYNDYIEFYDNQSQCLLRLKSTPNHLLCFTSDDGKHRSLVKELQAWEQIEMVPGQCCKLKEVKSSN